LLNTRHSWFKCYRRPGAVLYPIGAASGDADDRLNSESEL